MPSVSNAFEDYTSLENNLRNKHDNFLLLLLKGNSINVHSNTSQLATGWPYG